MNASDLFIVMPSWYFFMYGQARTTGHNSVEDLDAVDCLSADSEKEGAAGDEPNDQGAESQHVMFLRSFHPISQHVHGNIIT